MSLPVSMAMAVFMLFFCAHAVAPFIQHVLDRRRKEQERIYRIALYSLRDYWEGRR